MFLRYILYYRRSHSYCELCCLPHFIHVQFGPSHSVFQSHIWFVHIKHLPSHLPQKISCVLQKLVLLLLQLRLTTCCETRARAVSAFHHDLSATPSVVDGINMTRIHLEGFSGSKRAGAGRPLIGRQSGVPTRLWLRLESRTHKLLLMAVPWVCIQMYCGRLSGEHWIRPCRAGQHLARCLCLQEYDGRVNGCKRCGVL